MSAHGPLAPAELAQFAEQGYVVARGLLDYDLDIAPVIAEYEAKLDALLEDWRAQALLDEELAGRSFADKIISVIRNIGLDYSQPLDISLPQANVTADTPIHNGPAIFALLRSPRLLDAVEQFVGPEIYSNPVQHVRIKPPVSALPAGYGSNTLITQTPWHQDLGVVHEEADESNILTVWLPIVAATVENGCLAVVPGTHRGDLALHCPLPGKGATIPEERIPAGAVPLPMQPGDVLFMASKTMHTSLHNVSDSIRWSFDLRYNPIGQKTGRPWFPGFVARSRQDPATELRDAELWSEMWRQARAQIVRNGDPAFNRWDAAAPGCA